MTAKFDVLPGEDPEAFQGRFDAWMADLQPRNELERELAERAVRVSWQLDRVERAHVERLTARILEATSGEDEAVENDVRMQGERLFQESPDSGTSTPTFGPNWPARVVLRLESTAPGCRWLMDRWAELRSLLDHPAAGWQPTDTLRAIRLLGRQPIDALDDPRAALVFLALHAIDPGRGELLHEFDRQLGPGDATILWARLSSRPLDWLRPRDEVEAREALFQMIDRELGRLEAKFDARRRIAEIDAATAPHRLAFDETDEGERLRRYELSCGRALLRTIETFLKIRKTSVSGKPVPAASAIDLSPVAVSTAEKSNRQNEPSSAVIRSTTTDVSSSRRQPDADNEPDVVTSEGVSARRELAREHEISQNKANIPDKCNKNNVINVRYRVDSGRERRSGPRESHRRRDQGRQPRDLGRRPFHSGAPCEFSQRRPRGGVEFWRPLAKPHRRGPPHTVPSPQRGRPRISGGKADRGATGGYRVRRSPSPRSGRGSG